MYGFFWNVQLYKCKRRAKWTSGVTDEVDFTMLLCCIVRSYRSTKEHSITMLIYLEDYTHTFLVILCNERPPVAVTIAIYDMHKVHKAHKVPRLKAVRIFVMLKNADTTVDE